MSEETGVNADLNYEWLYDEKEIDKAKFEADKQLAKFSNEQVAAMRIEAKSNLFFLCHGILGYKRLSVNLHKHFCNWLQDHDDEQYRETLLPRGHFKSTIQAIGDSIRIILPDDAGTSQWPRNLGTNARVLLAHETVDGAARFLFSISGHFLHNPLLMGLFPECVPNPKRHRVNKHELELPRTEIWSEPTFDTAGVGAKSQGRHYNFLKLDDLFGDKARESETERLTTYDWFDNIQSFFSTFSKDHFDLIGTRYAFDDLYSHAEEMYGDQLVRYVRGVEEIEGQPFSKPIQGGKRVTIFPEEFTTKKLEILRKKPKIFNAQYANDPSAGSTEFDVNWLKKYNFTSHSLVTIFTGVGAGERVNLRTETDNIIIIDPAIGGLAAFLVICTDYKDRHIIARAEKKIWSPTEMVDDIFNSVVRWQPRIVVIEEVTFSALYKPWIEREMQIRGIRFRIEPAKTKSKQKILRVKGLENYLSAGTIFVNDGQLDLIEEVEKFGATDNIHLLDGLAYGPEFWRTGNRRARNEKEDVRNIQRDATTGYSQQ